MKKIGFEPAIEIGIKMKNQFIFDMAQMEGNTATFEQVETIADGISVGGLTTREVEQVSGITKGWNAMLELVKHKNFTLTKDTACYLNMLISANENYNGLGDFRIRGVRITGTDYIPPSANQLDGLWHTMIASIKRLPEDKQATSLYMQMARNQFFGDGNKRTALTMMDGLLISQGYAPLTVSRKENQEYRQILLKYYEQPITYENEFHQFLAKKQNDMMQYWGYENVDEKKSLLGKTKDFSREKPLGNTKPIKKAILKISNYQSNTPKR